MAGMPWSIKRQVQNRSRQSKKNVQSLSLEMVLRKSFLDALKEYSTHSSIGGVKQIFDPEIGWKQRIVWISIFLFMVCFFGYYLQDTWYNTLAKPLILTPTSQTEPISQSDFPAIALCNVNRISKTAARMLTEELLDVYPKLANRSWFVKKFILETGRLLDFSYDEHFDNSFHDLFQETFKLDNELSPKCSDMLLRCTWLGQQVDCNELFTLRPTARGYCCAFNYLLDYDENGYPNRTMAESKRQSIPGFAHGLNVVADPMIEDYAYPISVFHGFEVFIFDPTHFADPSAGKVLHRIVEPGKIEYMEMTSIKQVASPEIRHFSYSTRKCRFSDEEFHEYHNMYSYSACIVRCRIKAVQSLCSCIPYYLPAGLNEGPICFIKNLVCLQKFREKIMNLYPTYADTTITDELETQMEDAIHCSNCLPDCEQTRHIIKPYKISLTKSWSKALQTYGLVNGLNLTEKCIISVYYANYINNIDRLDVVAHWSQIISNIGGFGGVLMGISVFCIIEIVYFFYIRYLQLLWHNYNIYRNRTKY